uniref:WAT1-related protein n=1 Tax=Zea mays TaxID=4577 RepID=A0A804R4Z3_MAIZE
MVMMMRSCLGGGLLPVAVMLCLNVVAAVMVSLVKVAMDGGMKPLVIVTLQQLTAAVFLAPIAFFKERKSRPKLTLEIFAYIFVSAALGLRHILQGSSSSVHDLRGPALHHGHLRDRLLQHRPRAHLPPGRRHAVRSAGPQEQDGVGEAAGHAGVAGRRHGAHPLQGRGAHPRGGSLAGPAAALPRPVAAERRRQPRQVDAGHRGHPGQLRLPLLLVPAPRPPRQEVPARLLLQRAHVLAQLPPGRRRRPLHPAQHLPLDRHQQVQHPHRPIRRHRRLRRLVRAGDMVHREERSRVRGRLHTGGADHRLRHRLLHPARAALPRKRAGISASDRWPLPSAVGQEAGGPALSSSSSSKGCRRRPC